MGTLGASRYHGLAMGLHWLMAILILTNIIIGQGADEIASAADIELFQLHKSIGITVLVLTLLRIALRFMFKAPPAPSHMKPWERLILKSVHGFFYLLMLALPLTGWLVVSLSPLKIPTVLFGLVAWPHMPVDGVFANPKEAMELVGSIHGLLSNGLLALIVLHVGAALNHHFRVKDDVLFRMLPKFFEGVLKRLRGEKV